MLPTFFSAAHPGARGGLSPFSMSYPWLLSQPMSFDDSYSLLLSNSSDANVTSCGGETLESGTTVALGSFLAVAAFLAYIPQVLASLSHLHQDCNSASLKKKKGGGVLESSFTTCAGG
jgi:hypothetical protein